MTRHFITFFVVVSISFSFALSSCSKNETVATSAYASTVDSCTYTEPEEENSSVTPSGSITEAPSEGSSMASETVETSSVYTTGVIMTLPTESTTLVIDPDPIENTTAATKSKPTESLNTEDIDILVEDTYLPKVFMYHLIRDDVYGAYPSLFVRPSDFEAHLQLLNSLGYTYLFADEWQQSSNPSIVITLDDGYDDNYTYMFPLLKKYGGKATVFLVSQFIDTPGYLSTAQIKEMAGSGLVSFQCHTAGHSDLSYMSSEQLRNDFEDSVGKIEGITGRDVKAIAYPAGSYNDTVLSVVPYYFSFAYTTKSPGSVTSYSEYTIPRYYIARDTGLLTIQNFLNN